MGKTLSALAALASSLNAAEVVLKHSDGTECAIETRTDPNLGVVVHSSCPVVSSDGQFKSNFLKIQACNSCGVVGRYQVLDFICPSYFGAEVTITMSQTNGGSTNNHYIRGIWHNNHVSHSWDVLDNVGGISSGTTILISATDKNGASSDNSGRLRIQVFYGGGSFSGGLVSLKTFFGTLASSSNSGWLANPKPGWHTCSICGTLSNNNMEWAPGGSQGYDGAVAAANIPANTNFEVVASFQHDYPGFGMVWGPSVDYSTSSAAPNRGYWGGLSSSPFAGQSTNGILFKYLNNGANVFRYYQWKRVGCSLSIRVSTTSATGPWSDPQPDGGHPGVTSATMSTSSCANDKVALGIGEASGTLRQNLKMLTWIVG